MTGRSLAAYRRQKHHDHDPAQATRTAEMSYYQRNNIVHIDGTNVFRTQEDHDSEREIAARIEMAWKCQLHEFGALSPVDWYAVRFSRMIGVLELKVRSHNVITYPTVFLNVRKWLALSLASIGMGVPAIFVVKFCDDVRWITLANIDPRQFRIAGCQRLVKAKNDIEPVIEVPVAQFRPMRTT
jgi:hypothetical protein